LPPYKHQRKSLTCSSDFEDQDLEFDKDEEEYYHCVYSNATNLQPFSFAHLFRLFGPDRCPSDICCTNHHHILGLSPPHILRLVLAGFHRAARHTLR
jgi:hypothetical protein